MYTSAVPELRKDIPQEKRKEERKKEKKEIKKGRKKSPFCS